MPRHFFLPPPSAPVTSRNRTLKCRRSRSRSFNPEREKKVSRDFKRLGRSRSKLHVKIDQEFFCLFAAERAEGENEKRREREERREERKKRELCASLMATHAPAGLLKGQLAVQWVPERERYKGASERESTAHKRVKKRTLQTVSLAFLGDARSERKGSNQTMHADQVFCFQGWVAARKEEPFKAKGQAATFSSTLLAFSFGQDRLSGSRSRKHCKSNFPDDCVYLGERLEFGASCRRRRCAHHRHLFEKRKLNRVGVARAYSSSY